ncbi:MAG: rod shape-determining protein MreD [Candidatus Latescibacteria bacterium]|nr:rod shape-determining protein MreD [Candidatus Latescibacterota bacterium]
MKTIKNILLIALALLIQSSILGRFDIYGIRPDFGMMVLLYIANTSSSVESILYGFMIGFLQDVYSPEYLGFNALTMSIIGYLLGFVSERITTEKLPARIIVTLFACLLHDMLYLILYSHLDLTLLSNLFILTGLAGAVYTTVLSVLLITLWEWAENGGLFVIVNELLGSRR